MHRCARTIKKSFKLQAASHKRQATSDEQFRMILINKKKKSNKPQASSLTAGVGYDRMYLERNIMDNEQLKRIADAMEEILRLVKEDQDRSRKYMEEKKDE